MGELIYGMSSLRSIEMDDRTLAHVQAVVAAKLRQRQSFFFTWVDVSQSGGGRGSVWIDAAIPITFSYGRSVREQINRPWLELLMVSANSSTGLQLIPEPRDVSSLAVVVTGGERSRASVTALARS